MTETLTNEQILKKAIKKAQKNSYGNEYTLDGIPWEPDFEGFYDLFWNDGFYLIIFSHSFAKAFWTFDPTYKHQTYGEIDSRLERWQYHLQQMVLEKEPLKYLEKFL